MTPDFKALQDNLEVTEKMLRKELEFLTENLLGSNWVSDDKELSENWARIVIELA